MEHQKLDKSTVDYVWRTITNAIRSAVTQTPVAMGVVVMQITYQLSNGQLSGVVSSSYIQSHAQAIAMQLIGKQHIWATIKTVGERSDIYLMAAHYSKQANYRYEV